MMITVVLGAFLAAVYTADGYTGGQKARRGGDGDDNGIRKCTGDPRENSWWGCGFTQYNTSRCEKLSYAEWGIFQQLAAPQYGTYANILVGGNLCELINWDIGADVAALYNACYDCTAHPTYWNSCQHSTFHGASLGTKSGIRDNICIMLTAPDSRLQDYYTCVIGLYIASNDVAKFGTDAQNALICQGKESYVLRRRDGLCGLAMLKDYEWAMMV